jgi:hypothetical protein
VALSNVAITAYGITTTTDQRGVFLLKDISVSKDRCVLAFSKQGYFNRSHAFVASANTVNYLKIVLLSNAQTHTVSATNGGTITLTNSASIQFQPNSFVTLTGTAYVGTVSISFKHLSPDSPTFGFSIPGGDLTAINTAGNNVSLYSYGMFGVELTGTGGQQLQLATGKTATLSMPVAASQIASAPATIPLWHFNETTSLWMEEGQATLVGNKYVGTVSHFSWWNCDYQGERASIQGKVVDCNGNPMPNITVTINGIYTITTDQNGEYSNWIPAGFAYVVQVLAINNQGIVQNSQIENTPVLSPGQTFIVPALIVTCPSRVSGTIKKCGGAPAGGFVSVTNNNGFYGFQYTTNGVYNIMVVPNVLLLLEATDYSFSSYSQTVNSLASNNTLNLPEILLCDSNYIITGGNFYKLNGGSYNNQTFYLNAGSSANLNYPGTSILDIVQTGFTATMPAFDFHLSLPDTLPDTYFITDTVNSYISQNNGLGNIPLHFLGGLTVQLTEFGKVGERVKGSYYGLGNYYTTVPVPVQINGSFDVIRAN